MVTQKNPQDAQKLLTLGDGDVLPEDLELVKMRRWLLSDVFSSSFGNKILHPGGGRSDGEPTRMTMRKTETTVEDYLIKAQLWLESLSGTAFESLKHYAKDTQWL
ncbi:unnamed protein product [Effrenium voratum]|nr:unnamed protein product [Effrenium voratum]